jgi:hypothetical protein
MAFLVEIFSSIPLLWWIVFVIAAFACTWICVRTLETDASKTRRAQGKRRKELAALTRKISTYAGDIHRQFPAGNIVISERDLAKQLRKGTETVTMALNLLLDQQRVQKAPLDGYWKLNV